MNAETFVTSCIRITDGDDIFGNIMIGYKRFLVNVRGTEVPKSLQSGVQAAFIGCTMVRLFVPSVPVNQNWSDIGVRRRS